MIYNGLMSKERGAEDMMQVVNDNPVDATATNYGRSPQDLALVWYLYQLRMSMYRYLYNLPAKETRTTTQ